MCLHEMLKGVERQLGVRRGDQSEPERDSSPPELDGQLSCLPCTVLSNVVLTLYQTEQV